MPLPMRVQHAPGQKTLSDYVRGVPTDCAGKFVLSSEDQETTREYNKNKLKRNLGYLAVGFGLLGMAVLYAGYAGNTVQTKKPIPNYTAKTH